MRMLVSVLLTAALGWGCVPPNHQHTGLRVYKTPLRFYFDQSFPETLKEPAKRAAQTWNNESKQTLISFYDLPLSRADEKDGYNIIYAYKIWNGIKNQEANTQMYYVYDDIVEADVRLNLNWPIGTCQGCVDAESLFLHEFGHALGLMHNDLPQSIMNPILAQGAIRRELSQSEKDLIGLKYKSGLAH